MIAPRAAPVGIKCASCVPRMSSYWATSCFRQPASEQFIEQLRPTASCCLQYRSHTGTVASSAAHYLRREDETMGEKEKLSANQQ